jgi:Asp-tRNA(Asn)/Glu-tRNA(Gln) amidotransferase A subunit family amidase
MRTRHGRAHEVQERHAMLEMDKVTRRGFLVGASGLALTAGAGERDRPSPAPLAAMPNRNAALLDLSAVQAVKLMSNGDLAAEHYAQALLERCAEQKALNAFITLEPERVLEAARAADRRRASGAALGALHGLPVPIKDSLNTSEYPTTAGTPALRELRPAHDASIVAALVDAGAIVLGKTNLHELSYGWTSNNLAFGAVHNPYDPSRIPGGSSGGTAAAVAARMAPLGVAEDTEGSIRVPAALCGLSGFRPTTGRYPTIGAVPISSLFDQVGPHARDVADLALFDAVGSTDRRPLEALPLKGLKLAVARGFFYAGLDPEVERLTEAALAKLRAAGAELVEAEVPDLGTLIGLITDQVQDHDVRVELPEYLRTYGAGVSFETLVSRASTDIRETFAHEVLPGSPGFVSEAAYRAAVDVHLPRLRQIYRDYFGRTGAAAMVFPATMVTAPRIGEEVTLTISGQPVPFEVAIARNIAPGSTVGLPGLVLPAGIADDGLPVALEFDGPHGSDRNLLGIGLSIERVLGHIAAPRLR